MKFRYQVVIHVDDRSPRAADAPWLDWRERELTLPSLRTLLTDTGPPIQGVARVPNGLLTTEVETMKLLERDGRLETVADLRRAAADAGEDGVAPGEMLALREELPYSIDISWARHDADGGYDVVFRRDSGAAGEAATSVPGETKLRKAWRDYTNDPLQGIHIQRLVPQLRSFLKLKLPEFMVPSAFVLMDELPLTLTGKVDRRTLPPPEGLRPQLDVSYVMPRTEAERLVASVWQRILLIDKVGIHDNLFELGGHSLLMIRMQYELERIFERKLSIVELFQYPTIHSLAEYLTRKPDGRPIGEKAADRAGVRRARRDLVARRRRTRRDHRSEEAGTV
jgi:hypothetical protein